MGIPGLHPFLSSKITKKSSLDSLCIVVDANSLLHKISQQIDWSFGSQVNALAALFVLAATNFVPKPLFVFDGPLPLYKIPERLGRNSAKIGIIRSLNKKFSHSNLAAQLLPPFASVTVFNALRSNKFFAVYAEGEADLLIAKMASKLNCPVLSQDSDFYCYSIPCYIPIDSLPTTPGPYHPSDFKSGYSRDQIAKIFKINPDHFPILAILGGSDIITWDVICRIYEETPSCGIQPHPSRKRWPQIMACLKKLNNLSFAEARDTVVSMFNQKDSKLLTDAINLAASHYDCTNGSQDDLISIEFLLSTPENSLARSRKRKFLETPFEEDNRSFLENTCKDSSEAIQLAFENGLIHPKILEILNSHNFWCLPMLEDLNSPSCWNTSKDIRRLIYSILCPNTDEITEYTRNGMELQSLKVADYEGLSKSVNFLSTQAEKTSLFNDALGNPKASSSILFVNSLRHLIYQKSLNGTPLGNYVIAAIVCTYVLSTRRSYKEASLIRSLESDQGVKVRPEISPTLVSLHLLAELECCQFSLFLLAQLLLPYDSNYYVWELDPAVFHYCFSQARRGSRPASIIRANLNGSERSDFSLVAEIETLYFKLFEDISSGLDSHITVFFDYSEKTS